MKVPAMSRVVIGLLTVGMGLASEAPGSAQAGVAVLKVQIGDGIYEFITAPDGRCLLLRIVSCLTALRRKR